MVEIKGRSVTMLAIGPVADFSPEMIAVATWCSCSTPYGAYSVAESAEWPVTEGAAADNDSSAAPVIGKTSRFSVGFYPPRIWPERRQASRHRTDGIDWDRWFEPTAKARIQDRAGSAP